MKKFKNVWVVRVTFERMLGVSNDILSSEMHRASGYMAVSAETEWDVRTTLESELKDINLRLIETDNFCAVHSIDEVVGFDKHLAHNINKIEQWKKGNEAVWGMIHESYGIAC